MLDTDKLILFGGLAALSALKLTLHHYLHTYARPAEQLEYVGRVSSLRIYPLKSAGPIHSHSLTVDKSGILALDGAYDRYMMVAKRDGLFVTSKQYPFLVLVSPSVHGNFVHLDAPGMATLKIPKSPTSCKCNTVMCKVWDNIDVPSVDCGDEAAEWICKYLDKSGLRLFSAAKDLPLRDMTTGDTIYHAHSPKGNNLVYHGVSPCHMLTEETIADLNTRLNRPVTADNFRPNIVVSGAKAYDEFDWHEMYIGDVKYSYLFSAERCIVPTIDPQTAEKDPKYQPFKTLKSYMPYGIAKVGPVLGIQMKPDLEGRVCVGDPVYALRKSKLENYLF